MHVTGNWIGLVPRERGYILDHWELASSFAITCISSDALVVFSYDVKVMSCRVAWSMSGDDSTS